MKTFKMGDILTALTSNEDYDVIHLYLPHKGIWTSGNIFWPVIYLLLFCKEMATNKYVMFCNTLEFVF